MLIRAIRAFRMIAFLIPVFTMPAGRVMGQSYSFVHYQVENGLSNNAALCSLQDNNGFMWFGTKDGLNRFDGYTFKVFRNNPADARTIGNNVIYCLYQDKAGILWIGTDRGIYQYNAQTESFTFFKPGTEDEIRDIKFDPQGNIWFIAGITLYKYNLISHKTTVYNRPGLNSVSLAFVNGNLWVSTTARLIEKYDSVKDDFIAYDVFSHSMPATAYWIQKLADAGQGKLFIGTSNQGVKLFNTLDNSYRDIMAYNPDKTEVFVRDFIKQAGNNYWVATESGIYTYNLETGKITLLHKQYNNPYSLSDNAVYTFCKDLEGGIWAGTYFGGLNYYATPYTYFEKFFPKLGENALSGNAVREIHADNTGDIWIGTEDAGLNKLDIRTGRFFHFKPLGNPSDISTSNIHGLLIHASELLIGTFEHGLDIMDVKTGKVVEHFTVFNDTTLKSNFFYTLYETKNGDILAGTSRGLYSYSPLKHKFRLINSVPSYLFYTSILEDNTGTIWAGTYRDGLYYFNPHTGLSGRFKYDAQNKLSLSNNKVNRIFQDGDNDLWIATENGLCKLNPDKRNFTRLNTANGLPSNVIYAILQDAAKNLWVTTSKGLMCFNKSSGNIKIYTRANGLLSDQFNYNSAYKDPAGNIYFGCVKGMIKFNPDNFISNTFQPPVYITGLQVNNQDIEINKNQSPLKRSVTFTDTVKLNYNQSSFSIDFAALSYTSPQTAGYAYKMDGLDKEWIYLSSNRKVYFTRLSAGTYKFMVKASNNSGLWSKHTAALTIIIAPPLWASIYAWLLYVLLLALGIYFIVRNYHLTVNEKNRRKIDLLENEKEKEIYQAKIAFFTHVAHEIRTPLTLIKGPMEKVMQKVASFPDVKKNLAVMERNTDRLLTLTNQLLDFRKTEAHGFSLNFVKTDISVLVKEILQLFKPVIEQKKLHVKHNLSGTGFYAYIDNEALNKILSNLIDNSLKYAVSKVHISVELNKDANTFTILIKNDGHIIPYEMRDKVFETFFRMKEAEKHSGTGLGLPLSRYLAQLHKGTISLLPSEEGMNIFALILPIHQEIEFNI
ncbi:MAG: hybrid sensor histidine kinase/response regulator [Mucilaginibacter sp.]|nr:hybrid sensor histidine kinase/response regulator [Mucilaginibacter sp.]